jgi:hypothetical protein
VAEFANLSANAAVERGARGSAAVRRVVYLALLLAVAATTVKPRAAVVFRGLAVVLVSRDQ